MGRASEPGERPPGGVPEEREWPEREEPTAPVLLGSYRKLTYSKASMAAAPWAAASVGWR